jgi:hypothetical protein
MDPHLAGPTRRFADPLLVMTKAQNSESLTPAQRRSPASLF